MKKGRMLLLGALVAGVMGVKAQEVGTIVKIEVNNPGAGGNGWTLVQEAEGGVVMITEQGSYALTGSTSQNRVVVNASVTATLTLANCSMNSAVAPPLTLHGSGTTVTLVLAGNNRLIATGPHCGVQVEDSAALTITGEGTLTVTGGEKAAAIGAMYRESISRVGTICILDGNITATGGQYAAGIGGCPASTGGNINISGGTITANGGQYAAGIGGGWNGASGAIRITGGTISAGGGDYAAGVGGGYGSTFCDTISISGGALTATGGDYGAGIGKGADGVGGCNVFISGGITAGISGRFGAGIGGGRNTSAGNISISGGAVYACGVDADEYGTAGAGIGAGIKQSGDNDPTNLLINISGGTIVANRIGWTTANNTTLTYVKGGAILTDKININNSFGNAAVITGVNISQALIQTMAANHIANIRKVDISPHDTTYISLQDTLTITLRDTLNLVRHDTTFLSFHDTIDQPVYIVLDPDTWAETRVDNQLEVSIDDDMVTLYGLSAAQSFAIYDIDGLLIYRGADNPVRIPASGTFFVAQSGMYWTFEK